MTTPLLPNSNQCKPPLYNWRISYTSPTGRGNGFPVIARSKQMAAEIFASKMPNCSIERIVGNGPAEEL